MDVIIGGGGGGGGVLGVAGLALAANASALAFCLADCLVPGDGDTVRATGFGVSLSMLSAALSKLSTALMPLT